MNLVIFDIVVNRTDVVGVYQNATIVSSRAGPDSSYRGGVAEAISSCRDMVWVMVVNWVECMIFATTLYDGIYVHNECEEIGFKVD